MEWGAGIGPALSGVGGAVVLWLSQVTARAWSDRQRARLHREDREDLLFRTIRVLTDEVGRLRALCRHHDVSEEEIGPLIVTPWDERDRKMADE